MNFVELSLQFSESSALRLLRADTAPLIAAVLHSAFKREHCPVVPESRLRTLLQAELEDLRATGTFSSNKSAQEYLVEWADDFHGYVRRFQPPDDDEPAYELTPDTERVFQWIESLRPRPYVGTESKFKTLVHVLADLVENTTQSVDVRIERLRAEQARIEKEIADIQATGEAPVYNATQINERFLNLLDTARTLLGDFREVERHFRRVTEDLLVSRKSGDISRGQIVGQTLDAHERLRVSTQGQSFYAFWEFLLAPDSRAQFSTLVDQVYAIPELLDELREDLLLQGLQAHLRAEGGKVLGSNERLIAQLRRILDVRESVERREVDRVLQELKTLLHERRDTSVNEVIGTVDVGVALNTLMFKAQWTPPEQVHFGSSPSCAEEPDIADTLKRLLDFHPIDFEQLRANIDECLRTQVQISLPELLVLYPPRNGILEVLAYVVIAETEPHVIFDEVDVIQLSTQPQRRYRVPRVVFSNT